MAKTINGTSGIDKITVTESDITVNAGAGNDTITISSGSRNVIHGNADNDTITVKSGAGTDNKVYGDAGNDIVNAKENANSITVYGGDGTDTVYGGAGNDTLYGQAGNDSLYGGAGKDKLYGGSGDDSMYGQTGDDTLDGYTGSDTLYGGTGNDTLTGGAGKDTFVYTNGDGNDTITDYAAGDDTVKIASGSISKTELVNGTDVKFTVGSGSVTVKNGKGKVISLEDSRGSYTVSDTRIALGKDFTGEMDAGKYLTTVTNIAGGSAASGVTLRGNGNDNVMAGGAQSDVLYGDNGNDKLYGYAGNDTLYGQAGNDSLYGGAGKDKLYGGSGDDVMYGQTGDDTLDGYSGSDMLYGGTGNDTLTGGAGKDTFVYANGDGNDTITDYAAGDDTVKIASGSISKTELVNGTDVKFTVDSGSVTVKNGKGKVISLEDSRGSYTVSDTRIALGKDFTGEMDASKYLTTVTNIAGGSAASGVTLCGNGNDNVMAGGAQSDVLYGDHGDDKLYGYAGNDTLLGQAGNDFLYGGDGKDKLYGGSGDDVMYGQTGDDTLDGYTGSDTLYGGTGNDTLTGGAGKDTFVYANGDGNDTITDYVAGDDTVKIASGSISKTELVNGTDVKFTVGSGSVTVKNGKGKVISLEDSRGSYTVSDTRIALGKDFTGEMDAGKYLTTVTNIAGGSAASGVRLRGNGNNNVMAGGSQSDVLYGDNGNDKLYGYAGNDTLLGQAGNDSLYGGNGKDKLYGGSGDDILYGDAGNDTLVGGTGSDTYVISSAFGANTVISIDQTGYNAEDKDVLQFTKFNKADVSYALTDGTLSIMHTASGGKVNVSGWNDNPLKVQFADGTSMTAMDINRELVSAKVIKISKSGTYQATGGADTFLFDKNSKGWDVTIVGANSKDLLDFSDYMADFTGENYLAYENYCYVDEIHSSGTDLKMELYQVVSSEDISGDGTVIETDDELIGMVTVKDYFKTDDKISSVKLYPSSWMHQTAGPETIETRSFVVGGEENVDISGTGEKDFIITGSGNKTVNGGGGDDYIEVGWHSYEHTAYGNQTIYGGEGNDFIDVPENEGSAFVPGSEIIICGGKGNDRLCIFDVNSQNIRLEDTEGMNSFELSGANHTAIGGSEIDGFGVNGTGHVLECGPGDNISIAESLKGHSYTINQNYYQNKQGSQGEVMYLLKDEIEDLEFNVNGDTMSVQHINGGVGDGITINNYEAVELSIIVGPDPGSSENALLYSFGNNNNVKVYKGVYC